MKLLLLSAMILPLPLCAQRVQLKALQADINLAGIGLKTTFIPGPKTELDAGVGYGLSIVLAQNRLQYVRPLSTSEPPDTWSPELHHSPYVKLGFLYKLSTNKTIKPSSFYTKLQYTGWLPAQHVFHREKPRMSYQHRLALKAGYRKALNTQQTGSINFEAGVAAWSNSNGSFISAGPQLNINLIRDLFAGR